MSVGSELLTQMEVFGAVENEFSSENIYCPLAEIFGIKLFGLEEICEMYSGIWGQLFLDF